jgi:hypothetical protein
MRRILSIALIVSIEFAVSRHPSAAQQWQSMPFREDAPGIDENPLKGLMPFAVMAQDKHSFPHSMEWFYLPLSAVVTAPGTYDWSPLEAQLTQISGRGHQAVFRFYLDYPGSPSGIPSFLIASGLRTFPYSDEDNAASATPSVAPDYRDSRLMECLVQFIKALGAKYDGDVRIAYLTAGLYGFWGEWHVLDHPLPGEPPGWSISQKDKDRLLEEYAKDFNKTPVLVRTATVTKNAELLSHFGFHDDSFLRDTLGSEAWDFWQAMEPAGTEENWKLHPIGGEIYPQLQSRVWDTWPNRAGEDISNAITTTHATWMMDAALFTANSTPAERANALRAQRMMGYTLYCSASRLDVGAGGTTTLRVRIENRGVAPFYAKWPVDVEILNKKHKPVAEVSVHWPLETLLPGHMAEWTASLGVLDKRAQFIAFRVVNPMEHGHPVAFANASMSSLLPGWLTLPVRLPDPPSH